MFGSFLFGVMGVSIWSTSTVLIVLLFFFLKLTFLQTITHPSCKWLNYDITIYLDKCFMESCGYKLTILIIIIIIWWLSNNFLRKIF